MPPHTVSSAFEKMSTKRPSAIPQIAITNPADIKTIKTARSRERGPRLNETAALRIYSSRASDDWWFWGVQSY